MEESVWKRMMQSRRVGTDGAARSGSGWLGSGRRSARTGSGFRGGGGRRSGNWRNGASGSGRRFTGVTSGSGNSCRKIAEGCWGASGYGGSWAADASPSPAERIGRDLERPCLPAAVWDDGGLASNSTYLPYLLGVFRARYQSGSRGRSPLQSQVLFNASTNSIIQPVDKKCFMSAQERLSPHFHHHS